MAYMHLSQKPGGTVPQTVLSEFTDCRRSIFQIRIGAYTAPSGKLYSATAVASMLAAPIG